MKTKEVKKLGPVPISKAAKDISKAIHQKHTNTKAFRVTPTSKPAARKILILSCVHFPFQDTDMVNLALENEKDADVIVLAGDLMDQYMVSSFVKDKDIGLALEYIQCEKWINDVVADLFPEVVLLEGNHDARLKRFISTRLPAQLGFLVATDLLKYVADGVRLNTEGEEVSRNPKSNVHYAPGREAWWVKLGQTIIAHPLTYLSSSGGTVRAAMDYFDDKRMQFDSVVIGHTHYQHWSIKMGRVLMETGCLAIPMDYAKKGKLYYKNQHTGYAVVYQDADGRILTNQSRPIHLGTTVEHKDDISVLFGKKKAGKVRKRTR